MSLQGPFQIARTMRSNGGSARVNAGEWFVDWKSVLQGLPWIALAPCLVILGWLVIGHFRREGDPHRHSVDDGPTRELVDVPRSGSRHIAFHASVSAAQSRLPATGLADSPSRVETSSWRDIPLKNEIAELLPREFSTLELNQTATGVVARSELIVTVFQGPESLTSMELRLVNRASPSTSASPEFSNPLSVGSSEFQGLSTGTRVERSRPIPQTATRSRHRAMRSLDVQSGVQAVSFSPSKVTAVEALPQPREFALPCSSTGIQTVISWRAQPCRCGWQGRQIRIWQPQDEHVKQDQNATDLWAQDVGQHLDEQILPRFLAEHGPWPDIDGDGYVNILVTARVSTIAQDLQAFVRRQDFEADPSSRAGSGLSPESVPCDLIYVRPHIVLSQIEPLLIHELTHVVEFSWCARLFSRQPWPLGDWLTEGLAHAAEMRGSPCWENIQPRIAAFASCPERAPLVVVDAARSGWWRHPRHRGAAATFCYWWQQRQSQFDWPTFLQAQASADDPWQATTGMSFEEIYRQWTISLACEGVPYSAEENSLPVRRLRLTSRADSRLDMPSGQGADDQPLTIVLHGTSTAYIELPSDCVNSGQTLEVKTPQPVTLQVTQLWHW